MDTRDRGRPAALLDRPAARSSRQPSAPASVCSTAQDVASRLVTVLLLRVLVRACGWHSWAMTDRLDDALAVIRAATLVSGDLQKAVSWYFTDRLDVFDGLTAEALVLQGRARALLRYVESLEAGAAG